MLNKNVSLRINTYKRGKVYSFSTFVSPFSHDPIFKLTSPINIPASIGDESPLNSDFPMKIEIEITSVIENPSFNIDLVFDAE